MRMPGTVAARRVFAKLPYVENFTLTGSVAGYVDHTFCLNDIFDPDTTGTGHQPRGYDTWAVTYNKYRVHACKVQLMGGNVDIDGAGTYTVVIGSNISDSSSGAGGPNPIVDLLEGPQAEGFHAVKWTTYSPRSTGFSSDLRRISRRMYVPIRPWQRKMGFASWSSQLDQQNIWTSIGANPTNPVYLNIFMGAPDNADTTGFDVEFVLKLTYYVEWAQPDFESIQ